MTDFNKKVTLIEVEIDNDKAIQNVEDLSNAIVEQNDVIDKTKRAISDLTKENKELSNQNGKTAKQRKLDLEQIDRNVEKINDLKKAQMNNRDELTRLNAERRNAVKMSKLQSNSLDALRKTVVEQKKELNGLNTATEEGAKRFDELSAKLKENNERIKQLDTDAGDFKTTIGDYATGAVNAADSTGLFGVSLGGAMESMKGLTASSLRFLATPIGAVVGAIALAFGLVANAMNRSEDETNKIKKAFSAFSGIVNLVLEKLTPLGEFLIDGIVKGFELAGKAADKAMGLISDGLEFLGFEEAAEGVREFNEEIKVSVENAQKLAEAEANLQKEQRLSEKVMLDYQKQAEILRQERDDETKSFKERIKANRELGEVLNAQLEEEKRIAQIRLDAANLRIKLEGETTEALDEQAEALTAISEIEERITGQRSEQLTNQVALEKERQAMLDEQAAKRKAQEEKEAAERKARQLKEFEEWNAAQEKRIELEEMRTLKLIELGDFRRQKRNEAYIAEAQDLQEAYNRINEIEESEFQIQLDRLEKQNEILQENDALTKEEKLLAEAEFNLAKEELEAEHAERMLDIKQHQADDEARIEEEKKARIAELSNLGNSIVQNGIRVSNNIINGYYDKRLKSIQEDLKRGNISEEEAAEKSEAINKKRAQELYKTALVQHRIEKATAISSIGISTAQAIMKTAATVPYPANIPLTIAQGLVGAAQLTAAITKPAPPPPTFAQGGSVTAMLTGGKDHSAGGTKYFGEDGNTFEVQSNEGIFVTKREATNPALQMLDSINQQYGGNSMFSGGSSYLQEGGQASGMGIDEKSLSLIMMEAIENLPVPILPVKDVMAGINENIEANEVGVV